MAGRRTQRVGESIREVLGELIQRHVKDPRIGFVTITAVRVTPDLGRADVYYTVLGDEKATKGTAAGLRSATPFLRTETGRRLRLKTLPALEFHVDDSPEKGLLVDSIIEEIHKQDASDPLRLPPLPADVDLVLQRAVEALESASTVGIVCHISPDGDALGSILGAAMALDAMGVRVQASWDGDPVALPTAYEYLPGARLLVQTTEFRPPDVALALDCANADRMGTLRERVQKAGVVINIDHHISSTRFPAINVVDAGAASTAELVLQLLVRMGAEITPDVATCLYTGLVTDTGRFSYEIVSPRTHATAAFLLQRGVPVAEISQRLYESAGFSFLKLLGRALERARLDEAFVVTHLTQADLAECGVTMDDTDDVIDYVRAIRERDVTLVLKELPDGKWKASLRSKGETNVSAIAERFGGGGHELAAGFTSETDLESTIVAIKEALATS